MYDAGIYITNRLQDKASFMHSGMGNGQVGRFDDTVIIKYDVDIQNAGAEANGILFASCQPLDLLNALEKRFGPQNGLDLDSRVDEPILVGVIDRFGFIEWGLGQQAGIDTICQGSYAVPAVGKFVSDVGADGKNSGMLFHVVELATEIHRITQTTN